MSVKPNLLMALYLPVVTASQAATMLNITPPIGMPNVNNVIE